MRTLTRYEVRYWPPPGSGYTFSRLVGKRLVGRHQGLRVVKRLQRRGVLAFLVPMRVNLP